MKKIIVFGCGYVGTALSVFFAQKNEVIAYDIDLEKINKLNQKETPIKDDEIQTFLRTKKLNLRATNNIEESLKEAEIVIICTPTNYDENTNVFDTQTVENSVKTVLDHNNKAIIIIKSTIPIGFTKSLKEKYSSNKIIFSPEFLREGKALYDTLNPSRLIIGDTTNSAQLFADLVTELVDLKEDELQVIFTDSCEAEAIKLFSNTYLAMRIAYFNEIDTFCETKSLNTYQIINGLGFDSRIGNHYNNPSFGYGGYCLPKDTKQTLANFNKIPNKLIRAIVESNTARLDHIADVIEKINPKVIGIYLLAAKKDSDNARSSATSEVINRLKKKGFKIIIFDPSIKEKSYSGLEITKDLSDFKKFADLIVANRLSDELDDVIDKVYTRDIFGIN